MARTKSIAVPAGESPVTIPFTVEEEAKWDARAIDLDSVRPMQNWLRDIKESDHTMLPRWMEDHISSEHDSQSVDSNLQQRYTDKKALRDRKPGG